MKQRIPILNDKDLLNIIKREFPLINANEIYLIIDLYKSDSKGKGDIRVKVACIKLSNGNIEELKRNIEMANIDYRDILMQAEYPLCMEEFNTRNNMEIEKIYEKDWNQCIKWIGKKLEYRE